MHRDALAAAVRHRRGELGLKQAEVAARAGLRTRKTVATVEAGRPVKEFSLYALDRGLDWPTGTALHILTHGQPARDDYEDDPEAQAIWNLDLLAQETRLALIDELRRRRRAGPKQGSTKRAG